MIRTVAIVIPAGNEESLIGSCLAAIAAARRHAGANVARPLRIRTVVVLDRCVDSTALTVSAWRDVETVICDAGRVGTARAQGVSHVLADTEILAETWIANTDADSRVPSNWITHMIEEADRGADLVLGTVTPADGLSPLGRRRWRELHQFGDGHPHVHGANFGIRADVYSDLGGWPHLASGEDVALAERACESQRFKVARTGAIRVITSGRLDARAPNGFATYLHDLVRHTFLDPDDQPFALELPVEH